MPALEPGARVRVITAPEITGTYMGHTHSGFCGVAWDDEPGTTATVRIDRIEHVPVPAPPTYRVQLTIDVAPETATLPARYTIITGDGVTIAEQSTIAGALDVLGAHLYDLADTARGVVGK